MPEGGMPHDIPVIGDQEYRSRESPRLYRPVYKGKDYGGKVCTRHLYCDLGRKSSYYQPKAFRFFTLA